MLFRSNLANEPKSQFFYASTFDPKLPEVEPSTPLDLLWQLVVAVVLKYENQAFFQLVVAVVLKYENQAFSLRTCEKPDGCETL